MPIKKLPLPWLESGGTFPPVDSAWDSNFEAPGLLAAGGDLSVGTLLRAYGSGIFPWFSEGQPILWWSPDPRMVLSTQNFRLHRSLRQALTRFTRSADCEIRFDTAFSDVITACASSRRHGQDGTWILPEMVRAYSALQRRGNAHSIEVWSGEELVGGVYGVQFGRLFCAESMFHRATDMSKVALVTMVRALFGAGIRVFEVQFVTTHLASLGAFEISRTEYLQLARGASAEPLRLGDPLAGAPSREL